nr:hypothetical protein [Pseudomonadota bacterium]
AMLIIFGAGIIPSNTLPLALAPFRHKGGSAGAIYGSITMLSVFSVSLVASLLPANNVVLAMIYLGLSLTSIAMVLVQMPLKVASPLASGGD